jgi:hypothetical protein
MEKLILSILELDAFREILDNKYRDVRGDQLVYGRESFLSEAERSLYKKLSTNRADATSVCTSEQVDRAITIARNMKTIGIFVASV